VRSAEAFGATGILTTPGTVSAWNQKALRASVGSVFRVPVVSSTVKQIAGLKAKGVRLVAAVGEGGDIVKDGDFAGPCGLLIGNEGAGLDAEWLKMADVRVTIPCPGPVESLNAAVAGSLLLYEASRQRATASTVRGTQ
jgi:TrmH family RNA methyltransferase